MTMADNSESFMDMMNKLPEGERRLAIKRLADFFRILNEWDLEDKRKATSSGVINPEK